MMEVPDEAVQAAAEVRLRQYGSEFNADHLTWRDFESEVREVLEAAFSRVRCGVRTGGDAFLGHPGWLECARPPGHTNSHQSTEGAAWY